jgi:hypothetical protein
MNHESMNFLFTMVRITTNKEENGSTKKEHELSKHAVDHSSNTIKQNVIGQSPSIASDV